MSEKKYRLPRKFAEEVWFPALLSGEYQQGHSELCSLGNVENSNGDIPQSDTYCCLGVAGIACGIPKELMVGLSYVEVKREHKVSSDEAITLDILTKAAIAAGYPKELLWQPETVENACLAAYCADLNDSEKYSFEKIVEAIRENVELYDEENL